MTSPAPPAPPPPPPPPPPAPAPPAQPHEFRDAVTPSNVPEGMRADLRAGCAASLRLRFRSTRLAYSLLRSVKSYDSYVQTVGPERASFAGWRASEVEAAARHHASPRIAPKLAWTTSGLGAGLLAIDVVAAHNGWLFLISLGLFVVTLGASRHRGY